MTYKSGELKKALVLGEDAEGNRKVLSILEGEAAEEVIAKAEAAGLEVRKDAQEVEKYLNPQLKESNVPPEIYDLMSTIIGFAQELNERWGQPDGGKRVKPR